MTNDDKTPDGQQIETHTLWLDFPEGEAALSLDLTRFNAAMRAARDSFGEGSHTKEQA